MKYKYDWEKIVDRSNTNTRSVEVIPVENATVKDGFSKIPMWVADMNFETVPTVPEEIIKRAKHPLYGYFITPSKYFSSIINWQKIRNGVNVNKENIGYENGVLGALSSVAKALATRGASVLLHAPTYIGFTRTLKENGYNIVLSNLYLDENNIWRMDYEDMDRKIKENNIQLAVFCSPHNPSGRVWEREELEKAFKVFEANNVFVISDEIWSDLILERYKHIPSQSISEDAKMRTIALYAPSKTFNLAGLVGAYHIIYNDYLRKRIEREAMITAYNSQNVLSCAALIGAYSNDGEVWLDELRDILSKNVDFAYNFIKDKFEGVELAKPQSTYLLYINTKKWEEAHNKTTDDILKRGVEYGVIWQDGRPFNVDNTIRINLALPKSRVEEAFSRLDKYVFNGEW